MDLILPFPLVPSSSPLSLSVSLCLCFMTIKLSRTNYNRSSPSSSSPIFLHIEEGSFFFVNHDIAQCLSIDSTRAASPHTIARGEGESIAELRQERTDLRACAALRDSYIMEMATYPVNEVSIKPSSQTSSLGGHKPYTLKQLKVGKLHRQGVVFGSLCVRTLCRKTAGYGRVLINVLEDDDGDAISIHLCNAMEGNGGSAQAQRLFPHGCRVGMKNPYLTILPDGEVV